VRVAAVDLGTNSTRLLVADVERGELTEVARRLTITRLGEDVDRGGALVPAAVERVRVALAAFRDEADALGAGRRLAIATSAVRDASNGSDVLAALEAELGFDTRLLSGTEEAALTFRGVSSGRIVTDETLIVDIGGGSTELVLGSSSGISFATSLQIGCVRLTERLLHTDPPAPGELAACAATIRGLLPPLSAPAAIGVAGTVTSLAALDLGLAVYDPGRVHGHRIGRAAAARELARLAAMTVSERAAIPVLEPGRAAVIVAGAVILDTVLETYGLDGIEASERDILDGVALLAAAP